MADWLKGTRQLAAWRRIAADGTISYPLGADPRGQLIYASNGMTAVQIAAASRPPITTGDPLGGETAARADAYSTYLAYLAPMKSRTSRASRSYIISTVVPS